MTKRLAEQVFLVSLKSGRWPTFENAEQGRQLAVFFPDGATCEQVNYGQGEGQVLIDGNEWGFYWNDDGGLTVILHDGTSLDPSRADNVVASMCSSLRDRGVGEFVWSRRG